MFVNTTAFLINEESFVSHHHAWLSINEVKVSHQIVRVEVELLNAEGSWHLTLVVDILFGEHDLLLHAVKDVSSFGVSQITSSCRWVALTVLMVSILVGKHNNVTFLVTVEITKDIVLIEKTVLPDWWLFKDGIGLGSEIFESITLHFHCVIVNRVCRDGCRLC